MAIKKFDTDVVLEQTINTFWRNGYYGTSMQQLLQATGLRPGSLYREFENKEALYRCALRRYAEQTISNVNTTITNSKSVLLGIKLILIDLFEEAKTTDYCGCFLIKSQLELSAHNEIISSYVIDEFARIEANYRAHLQTIFTDEQSYRYAKQLMIVIFGIRVYGYQKNQPQSAENILLDLLSWLRTN